MRTEADTVGPRRSPWSSLRSLADELTRRISDRVWRARPSATQRRWQAITLVGLCLAVYVPGLFTIPPIDRDESRFAQASRQMYESVALPEAQRDPAMHSGGLSVPYVIDKPRLNKPPLIYWAQVTSAAVFTLGDPLEDAIWMYRLPSAVFAVLTVLMTWRIGLLLFDARAAWLGAAVLAICPLVVIDAHQGRADQLLLACTTGAMWALAGIVRATEQGGRAPFRLALGLAIAIAAGVLTKGPITPMVVALAAIAFAMLRGRFRWLIATHPWLAAIVTAATIGPWVYAVAQHFGFEEYRALVFDETVGRSASAKEGHWGPPGYHLLLLPVLFWPGSLGLGLGVVYLWNRRKRTSRDRQGAMPSASTSRDREGAVRGMMGGPRSLTVAARLRRLPLPARWQEAFLLAWIIPAWIVFELVSTKLPHYTMPMYPAVALLCARALCQKSLYRVFESPHLGRVFKMLVFLWGIVPWLLAVALLFPARHTVVMALGQSMTDAHELHIEVPTFDLPWLSCLAAAVVLVVGTWRTIREPQSWSESVARSLGRASMTWTIAFALLGTFAIPKLNTLSTRIARSIEQAGWTGDPVVLGNYQEDSLVFLLRGRAIRIGNDDDAAQRLRDTSAGFFVMERNPGRAEHRGEPAWIAGSGVSKGPSMIHVFGPAP